MRQRLSTKQSFAVYAVLLAFMFAVFVLGIQLGREYGGPGTEAKTDQSVPSADSARLALYQLNKPKDAAPQVQTQPPAIQRQTTQPATNPPVGSAQAAQADVPSSGTAGQQDRRTPPPTEIVVTQAPAGSPVSKAPVPHAGTPPSAIKGNEQAAKGKTGPLTLPPNTSILGKPAPAATQGGQTAAPPGLTGEYFSIQIGAVDSEAEAQELLTRLKARGYSGILDRPVGQDKFFRVRVGAYAEKAAAVRAEQLLKEEGFPTYVKKLQAGRQGR